MRITRKQLRQIIQEELARELNEDAHESEPLSYVDKLGLVTPSDMLNLYLDPKALYQLFTSFEDHPFDKENPAVISAIVRAIVDGLAIGSSVEESLREVIGRIRREAPTATLPDPDRIIDLVRRVLELSSQSHQMPDEQALRGIVSSAVKQ